MHVRFGLLGLLVAASTAWAAPGQRCGPGASCGVPRFTRLPAAPPAGVLCFPYRTWFDDAGGTFSMGALPSGLPVPDVRGTVRFPYCTGLHDVQVTVEPGRWSVTGTWKGTTDECQDFTESLVPDGACQSPAGTYRNADGLTGPDRWFPPIVIAVPGANALRQLVIPADPVMPAITVSARLQGLDPDPTAITTFTWTVHARQQLPRGRVPLYWDDYFQRGLTSIGTQAVDIPLTVASDFVGGDLLIEASGNQLFPDQWLHITPPAPAGYKIVGTNPPRADIQQWIAALVPAYAFSGLAWADVIDALQRVACDESQQRNFEAPPNGGVGDVIIAPDLGFGLFQLTNPSPTGNPPLIYNWKENARAGTRLFSSDAAVASGFPPKLRGSRKYQAHVSDAINPARQAAGRQPIAVAPAPDFTKLGLLGAAVTNQQLEDAVRAFNGYGDRMLYGFALHEFEPDDTYLIGVSDAALPGLGADPRVWGRVPVAQRGPSGDPDYVAKVTRQSPLCPL